MTKERLKLYKKAMKELQEVIDGGIAGVYDVIADLVGSYKFTKEELEELGYDRDDIELAWEINCLDEED